MNFKKYLNIGVIVGTAVTIERLIRKWEELFEDAESKDGWWAFGGVIGAHLANVWNIVTWPLAIISEISEFIRKD